MYTAIVFLPLIGFLIASLFGRQLGARPSEFITTLLLFLAAALSWIALFQVGFGSAPASVPVLANWITSGTMKIDWALRIDTLTVVMMVVINSVSALVHLYSIGYMHKDPHRPRFFAYLSLFTFAMLMLVTADNLVQMFFGWEGVGLASYLLIGFWYEKPSANAAAIKAFVVNRVGDFGFALGIFLLFALTGSVALDQIFAAAPGLAKQEVTLFGIHWNAMTAICLLLFMGAMGKSAQFLLHTWLPDAMEGPTPVSALIHAATMVTAGVFMVARLSPLFEFSPAALNVVIIFGATTAFFAATVGLVQNDIKRVIAYSTCSQLGYMFVAIGAGAYSLAIFHLFTHAFFKALLFLGAGSVIHAMHHEQDMRRMGGLYKHIPVTFWMMTIGTLALTGFPLMAGFFSKDAIIEAAYASQRPGAVYAFLLIVAAAALTSFYSWRLVFMTFFGKERWHGESHQDAHAAAHGHGKQDHATHHDDHHHGHHAHQPHESPQAMLVPLYVLAVGAIFAGLLFKGAFIGDGGAAFWKQSLFYAPDNKIL
ncbi:MAG: NADH-quinone oxidoreductase subunit L, partial [Alphaproteobacteria bacterium]|nr:NADH-quinone oxidoreductase subunit L [Alphaproteobacteria bacterium]